eukprot:CAMPEP_0173205654 /NCGR_PEP_ID=MMETSP1141-20130122/20880_1 /TAXON_ID=483371 /ORGANISM="non described non described, Strain CCMP2298" /LENGTH=63 /DNA_ID=CAMNT_0014131617 /DNA_START=30 /DNA_END=218 /DNA_ORIENTATION=-
MTTTGYGDITPQNSAETAYTIFVCIVGPTIFATIVGKVASYVKQVDASTNNIQHRLTVVSCFL